jgi:hypothetical protein
MWLSISSNESRGLKDLVICGHSQESLAYGRLCEARTTCFIGTLHGNIRVNDSGQKRLLKLCSIGINTCDYNRHEVGEGDYTKTISSKVDSLERMQISEVYVAQSLNIAIQVKSNFDGLLVEVVRGLKAA